MSTDFARLVEQTRAMAEQVRNAAGKTEDELSGTRFAATSDRELVTAVVDHRARVLDIRFARGGLTRTRGGELARHVVEMVAKAREQARADYLRSFRAHARNGVATS